MKFIVKPLDKKGKGRITMCWKCGEDPRACW